MINFIAPGDVMEFTASGSPENPEDPVVLAGSAYLIGDMLVIASTNALDGETFRGRTSGVFENMPKATGEAWDEGQLLYWDNDAGKLTTTETDNRPVGCAAVAAESADTTGTARLSGTPAAAILGT